MRSILWSSWGQLSLAALGLVWLFTVPRTLGAERYGLFVLLSSLIDFHNMACTLGIHNAFAYYSPLYRAQQAHGQLAQLRSGYSGLVMGVSVLGVVVIGTVGRSLGAPDVTRFMVALLGITALLQAVIAILGGYLYGENRIALFAARPPLQQMLMVPLVVGGGYLYGVTGALAGAALGTLLVATGLLAVVKPWQQAVPAPEALPRKPLAQVLRQPVTFGVLAMFGSLAALTITRGGNIILAGVGRTNAEVAVFAVGLSFVLQGGMLLSALGTALTPGLSQLLAAGDTSRAHDWVGRAAKYQVLAALAAIMFVLLLGEPLLQAALGDRFPDVFGTTLVGVLALLPMAQNTLTNQIAIAWGIPRINLEAWLVMSLVFLLSAGIFGATYGAVGAAGALVGTAALTAVVSAVRLRALGGPLMWSPAVIKLVLLGLPGVALLQLHVGVVANAGLYLGYLAYLLGAAMVTGVISREEIQEMMTALVRRQR